MDFIPYLPPGSGPLQGLPVLNADVDGYLVSLVAVGSDTTN